MLYDRVSDATTKTRPWIVDFKNNSTEKVVHFTIKFKKEDLHELRLKNEIENVFKLTDTKYTNYSNMHLYNSKGVITKYDTVEEILREFYMVRLAFYMKRKEYMLRIMQHELDIYQAKIRFIEEFIDGTIDIMRKEDEEIQLLLEERHYPKFGANDNTVVEEFSYDYLLNMKIRSLTKKKIDELKGLFEKKQALYNELSSKTEKELWKDDLNEFLVSYRKNMEEYNEILDEQRRKLIHPASLKKKVVVKKAAGGAIKK
jgi:DNA topoisomerase-2